MTEPKRGHRRDRITIDDVRARDLQRVRGIVERAAAQAGITAARTSTFVIAVNEVIVNAILYAGGHGRVAVELRPEGLLVEVSDSGPGLPAEMLAAQPRPAPGAESGRGLWLARRFSQRMHLSNSPGGLTVRLFAARA